MVRSWLCSVRHLRGCCTSLDCLGGLESACPWEMEAVRAVGLPAAELDVRITPERSEERNLKAF